VGLKAKVEVWGKVAYVKLETGGEALIPLSELCGFAKRFGLVLEGYDCELAVRGSEKPGRAPASKTPSRSRA